MSFDSALALKDLLGSDGLLASQLHGFAARPAQLEMATSVLHAMETGEHLAIEAGAGTGKTISYLIPALIAGRRIIIATATRTLQDQLYHRDLPVVCRAMGRPVRIAQLKGRANYLCRYRLGQLREYPESLLRGEKRDFKKLDAWAALTQVGDVAEVAGVAEHSRLWERVTSTAENCLGSSCPSYDKCHVVRARDAAQKADLAIVNHHLLVADLTLKEDGFGSLLPGADAVIVDEAHRFPEVVQGLFDVSFSSRQLGSCLDDLVSEAREAGVLDHALQQQLATIGESAAAINAAIGRSATLPLSQAGPDLADALAALAEGLETARETLAEKSEATPGLSRCAERMSGMATSAAKIASWQENSDLCWAQGAERSFSLHMTPLDAAAQTKALLAAQSCTWIMTSATLAVGADFSHFVKRLGLSPMRTHQIASPYDFRKQAILYLPPDLPMPDSPDYPAAFIGAVLPVIAASGGRAFLLFTSRKALLGAADRLQSEPGDFTVLVQGSASRTRLLELFTTAPRAVLLGTATFWEGVDIRGAALVVVAIDRLPFASPGDPYLQARLEIIRRDGGDPFRDYQLPQAVLALRQGVGRLIRGPEDYGVVMLCDPRLRQKSYGKVFLASLPPMPIVEDFKAVQSFLASHEEVV
jgi:ATP-dependent DNA helicase DinG